MERTNQRVEDEFHQSGIEIDCVKGMPHSLLVKGIQRAQLGDAIELLKDEFKIIRTMCVTGSKPWLVNIYCR